MRRLISLVLTIALGLPAWAQEPPGDEVAAIIDLDAIHNPVIAAQGMVASQEAVASKVGADILAQGGNAVDAAVAVGFALAVTLPRAGNLGGGGFMLVHLADTGRDIAIDYREMAPKAAGRDMFLDAAGEVDNDKARFSHAAAGVPGTVAGLAHALRQYGTMPLTKVMAPAIALAEQGIVVSYDLAGSLARARERLSASPAARAKFFHPDGSGLRPGETWRQQDLARSLKKVAKDGPQAFYRGAIAKAIAKDMAANGGLVTLEDLAAYRVIERPVLTGVYRGYRIVTMPPPSSGGVHLIQMLNVLEGDDLKALGVGSADYIHLLAATMKQAYADRSKYLGDPDFFDVPVAALTDKAYARAIRAGIDMARARPSHEIAPAARLPFESNETTHFSVLDRWGNAVANTYTLNFSYGSGRVAAGTGILLNNEMDDFSAKPGAPNGFGLIGGEANAIAPGKRPLSSMTPVIVLKDDKPFLLTGSPGGSTIITTVLQMLLNVLDHGMNVAEATATPRIHHQWLPDRLFLEPGISPDTVRLLEGKGYKVFNRGAIGATQSIQWRDGLFFGAADPRRPAAAAVGVD
ncbi:MAG: gamma-glutamyltransferase [Pseudomonadota bacterium]